MSTCPSHVFDMLNYLMKSGGEVVFVECGVYDAVANKEQGAPRLVKLHPNFRIFLSIILHLVRCKELCATDVLELAFYLLILYKLEELSTIRLCMACWVLLQVLLKLCWRIISVKRCHMRHLMRNTNHQGV